ncbi:MAG TPA: hypothetical protein VN628_16560, partial [Vicinamibacterales bacterium]|nr:hypothetical protein [Vicinamibacterales bacterium]
MKYITLSLAIALGLVAVAAQAPQPQQPQQPNEVATVINGDNGGPPLYAVPQFLALTNDAETVAAAKTITDVLWDDLNYENELRFVARDIYTTIPAARSVDDVPFDRWLQVNADAVISGSVQKSGTGFLIKYRLYDVKSHRAAISMEYSGSSNARRYAHTISDEIFLKQRNLRGVARTKLAFTSDRDGERLSGTVE